MPARIRLRATTSEIGWRATASFVREVFRTHGLALGLRTFGAKFLREPFAYGLPTWLRRYWGILLFAATFGCSALVLILVVISPRDVASLAAGDAIQRLSLARFVVAVLTFLIALVGSVIALGQIVRALARPDLYATFVNGSTFHAVTFEMPRASGDAPWVEVPIYLRNVSRVAANHAKVALVFKNAEPFVITMKESLGMPANSWRPTGDAGRDQWEFASVDPFRVYGQDDYLLGMVHLSVPPLTVASDLGWDLPTQHHMHIYPVVHDDWGRRQRPVLWLTVEAR